MPSPIAMPTTLIEAIAAAIDSQRVCSGTPSASLLELPSIVMLGS